MPELFTDRRANSLATRREKLPWPADHPFKILSLDGGGIRGIFGATIIKKVEQELCHGVPLARHVDMIAGTSTGGIMAIALGLLTPAQRVFDLYNVKGEEIFRPAWYWRIPCAKKVHQFFGSLYNPRVLEEALKAEFQERLLGQSACRLVIPSFMTPKSEIAVFKTDHHPDYRRDHAALAWQIARATSAAPTFFKGVFSNSRVFLDGGVWANNPIMVALVDALSAYDLRPEQIEIVSIGTGNTPFSISSAATKGGFFAWREVIEAAMYLTTDNAQAQAGLLLGPDRILRMEPPKDAASIELDDWTTASATLPPLAEHAFYLNKPRLEAFFSLPVPSRHRFYTA